MKTYREGEVTLQAFLTVALNGWEGLRGLWSVGGKFLPLPGILPRSSRVWCRLVDSPFLYSTLLHSYRKWQLQYIGPVIEVVLFYSIELSVSINIVPLSTAKSVRLRQEGVGLFVIK
jgi:hypothetical protein